MFFRASEDSKGIGAGLYTVKGVLEKLNATIEVESKSRERNDISNKHSKSPERLTQITASVARASPGPGSRN